MSIHHANRPRFFEGQYLGSDDLDAVTEYTRTHDRRHALAAHTWGIAIGLDLDEVASTAGGGAVDVYVRPGCAWDGFGRPVVVLAPYRVPPERLRHVAGSGPVPVKLWLRYRQELATTPAPGFESCSADDSRSRVRESFEVVAGDFSTDEQRDALDVAGAETDALLALGEDGPLLCDGSAPFQALPDELREAERARWLIPLGYVTWQPGSGGAPGRFVTTSDAATLRRSRAERVYIGAVAESVHAADGVIRLRSRGVERPASGEPAAACDALALDAGSDRDLQVSGGEVSAVDLVWVEGSLRALGDVKLFGTEIDLRDARGDREPLLLRRVDAPLAGASGTDVQVVIGKDASGDNRFAVGPLDSGGSEPLQTRFAVLDSGEVGIGVESPQTLLHVEGDDDPTVRIEASSDGGAAGRVALRQSSGVGADLYYDDTAGTRAFAIDTVSGANADTRFAITSLGDVGIDTASPDHRLQIGDASATVSMSLRGPDGDAASSYLAFEDDGGTSNRWFRLQHDTQANTLRIASAEVDPILACERTRARVGIGTAQPADALDVRGRIRLGAGGELLALGAGASLRLLAGHVDASGNVVSGEGFSVDRTGQGSYRVRFTGVFASAPVVVACPFASPNADNVVTVTSVNASSFTVVHNDVVTASGTPHTQDAGFTFIAIGTPA